MTILTNIFYGALILFVISCLVNVILRSIVRHYEIKEAFAAKEELEAIKDKEYIASYIHEAFKDMK